MSLCIQMGFSFLITIVYSQTTLSPQDTQENVSDKRVKIKMEEKGMSFLLCNRVLLNNELIKCLHDKYFFLLQILSPHFSFF